MVCLLLCRTNLSATYDAVHYAVLLADFDGWESADNERDDDINAMLQLDESRVANRCQFFFSCLCIVLSAP